MHDYSRATTIDQHQGDHESGLPVTELVTITTAANDLGCAPGDDAAEVERLVDEVHAARVRLASLRAEVRTAVEIEDCDPDAKASAIHAAIARVIA